MKSYAYEGIANTNINYYIGAKTMNKEALQIFQDDVKEALNEFNSSKELLINHLENIIEHIRNADSKEEILEHTDIKYDMFEDICHIDIYHEVDSLTYSSTKLQDAKDVLRMITE